MSQRNHYITSISVLVFNANNNKMPVETNFINKFFSTDGRNGSTVEFKHQRENELIQQPRQTQDIIIQGKLTVSKVSK
jgi:hypothetical protein